MGLFDDMLGDMLEKSNEEIWGKYTQEEKDIIEEWNKQIGQEDALYSTAFRDSEFLRNLLTFFPKEEGFKYALNTYKYFMGDKNYDPEYVIFTRRAVPTSYPKPEGFWTSEHREVLNGLKNEIPEDSAQRFYSVIMVSTLKNLLNHGLAEKSGGASDGEMVIDIEKPFSDFLFMYKPEREIKELKQYQENGGQTYDEVLSELIKTAEERKDRQGFNK